MSVIINSCPLNSYGMPLFGPRGKSSTPIFAQLRKHQPKNIVFRRNENTVNSNSLESSQASTVDSALHSTSGRLSSNLSEQPRRPSVITPPIDLMDNENGARLVVSLPGALADEIAVDFNKDSNSLKVSAYIAKPNSHGDILKGHFNEINTGKVERVVKFDKDKKFDHQKLNAEFENGLLTVYLPRAEVKEKQVEKQNVQVPDTLEEPKQKMRKIQVEWEDGDW